MSSQPVRVVRRQHPTVPEIDRGLSRLVASAELSRRFRGAPNRSGTIGGERREGFAM